MFSKKEVLKMGLLAIKGRIVEKVREYLKYKDSKEKRREPELTTLVKYSVVCIPSNLSTKVQRLFTESKSPVSFFCPHCGDHVTLPNLGNAEVGKTTMELDHEIYILDVEHLGKCFV